MLKHRMLRCFLQSASFKTKIATEISTNVARTIFRLANLHRNEYANQSNLCLFRKGKYGNLCGNAD